MVPCAFVLTTAPCVGMCFTSAEESFPIYLLTSSCSSFFLFFFSILKVVPDVFSPVSADATLHY